MNTGYRRGSSFRIPGYAQNSVLQIIVASLIGYVLMQAIEVSLEVFGKDAGTAAAMARPMAGLPTLRGLQSHWWTPLTYGWSHPHFMDLLGNMIWLYTFGSIVQNLLGYRQVIPIFLYGLLSGAAFYFVRAGNTRHRGTGECGRDDSERRRNRDGRRCPDACAALQILSGREPGHSAGSDRRHFHCAEPGKLCCFASLACHVRGRRAGRMGYDPIVAERLPSGCLDVRHWQQHRRRFYAR